MSCWSLLIRCVLSIGLVLNGLGTGAAVHGGPLHAAPATQHAGRHYAAPATTGTATGVVSVDPSTATNPPCHGSHAAPAPDHSPPANDHSSAPAEKGSTDDGNTLPECCRDAGCAGACLQHSPAAMVLWIPLAIVTPPNVVSETSTPHALPERPPLTRPPDA